MKLLAASLLLPALLLADFATAQEPVQPPQPQPVPQPGVPVPQQRQRRQIVVPPPQSQSQGQNPEATIPDFEKNVTLRLEGSLFGAMPVNLSLLAGGREVTATLPVATGQTGPANVNLQATLTPGAPWRVALSISARVPITTGPGNIEYRDFLLATTLRIEPGKKVVLWQQGEEKLTLGLEEAKD